MISKRKRIVCILLIHGMTKSTCGYFLHGSPHLQPLCLRRRWLPATPGLLVPPRAWSLVAPGARGSPPGRRGCRGRPAALAVQVHKSCRTSKDVSRRSLTSWLYLIILDDVIWYQKCIMFLFEHCWSDINHWRCQWEPWKMAPFIDVLPRNHESSPCRLSNGGFLSVDPRP